MDGLWLQIMDGCRVHRCTGGGLYISAKSYAGYGACSAFLQAETYQIFYTDETARLNPHTGMSYQIRVTYTGYKLPPSPGHRNRSGVHSQQIGTFSHQIHTKSFFETAGRNRGGARTFTLLHLFREGVCVLERRGEERSFAGLSPHTCTPSQITVKA